MKKGKEQTRPIGESGFQKGKAKNKVIGEEFKTAASSSKLLEDRRPLGNDQTTGITAEAAQLPKSNLGLGRTLRDVTNDLSHGQHKAAVYNNVPGGENLLGGQHNEAHEKVHIFAKNANRETMSDKLANRAQSR